MSFGYVTYHIMQLSCHTVCICFAAIVLVQFWSCWTDGGVKCVFRLYMYQIKSLVPKVKLQSMSVVMLEKTKCLLKLSNKNMKEK